MNYNQAKAAYYDGLINETELNYYEYTQDHLNDLKTQQDKDLTWEKKIKQIE